MVDIDDDFCLEVEEDCEDDICNTCENDIEWCTCYRV